MMNKKILLPFALSTLAFFLQGCGSESAKINEDPNKGVKGVTSSTSCDITADNCLQFVLDYPVAGLNFDCSSDTVNHFATKLDSNVVSGACKLGDSVNFYIQGALSPRKISLGSVKLDNISKLKTTTLSRIRVVDFATALTGKEPALLSANDETIKVAMALVKIFQSLGIERGNNVVTDLQPTELTTDKTDKLSLIEKDVGVSEFISGEYAQILKPWLNVASVTDEQAFNMVVELLNLTNSGVWQAEIPIYKEGGEISSTEIAGVRPDGFFGCNKAIYTDCTKASNNLLHSMGSFFLLSDRQGYTLGYGQQWRGSATISNNTVLSPYVLTTKVKPIKIQATTTKNWFDPLSQKVNVNQPLHFSQTNDVADDILITQGKLTNGNTIAGTESVYRKLILAKDTDTIDSSNLGLWRQTIRGESYRGVIDIVKVNPSSYLARDIFRTEKNVESKQRYIFPLYATLTFKFNDTSVTPKEVNLGIVIDENGDIRTDIKKGATTTDMTGNCAAIQTVNNDGTLVDEYGEMQYRIGTTGATLFSANDKSISVRVILANPKFDVIDGAMFGLNLSSGSGAKINIHNLLDGQATGINLTNFANNQVAWSNTYAYYQAAYVNTYDKLNDTNKNQYVRPTDEERALAKRYTGTVSITVADQKIPACNAIKIKS